MLLELLAQVTTTTTDPDEVPRIVGDPLPMWLWLGAGALLLAAILVAGFYVTQRTRGSR
jgi:hypothetical protein